MDPLTASALRGVWATVLLPIRPDESSVDKTLAAIGGWAPIGTRVRWPHRSVPEEAIPALRAAAQAAVPELFTPEAATRS